MEIFGKNILVKNAHWLKTVFHVVKKRVRAPENRPAKRRFTSKEKLTENHHFRT